MYASAGRANAKERQGYEQRANSFGDDQPCHAQEMGPIAVRIREKRIPAVHGIRTGQTFRAKPVYKMDVRLSRRSTGKLLRAYMLLFPLRSVRSRAR